MIKSSCKDCEKRCLGCHDNCEDYKRFVEEQQNARKYNSSFKIVCNYNQRFSKQFIKSVYSK